MSLLAFSRKGTSLFHIICDTDGSEILADAIPVRVFDMFLG